MLCFLIASLIFLMIIISYRFLNYRYSYWKKLGVPQTNPMLILGDFGGIYLRKQSMPEMLDQVYKTSPNSRYIGMYQFVTPVLLIRDPNLIKQIAVKDFDYFVDHTTLVSPEVEPLFGKTLLLLKGQKWREMRSTVSPSFTSSKMKSIFSLISQNGEHFVKHFLDQEKEVIDVEMKDVFSKFANDVIANTVFGFECDSIKQPNNEFFLMGKEATDFTNIRKMFAFIGHLFAPKLIKLLGIRMFSEQMTNYFTKIVRENIESREKHGVVRPDMISILLEAKKNNLNYEENTTLPDTGFATIIESEVGKNQKYKKIEITDEDITSQAFVFFFAGFDSVSTLLSFMAYELAVNQDAQKKLLKEVDATREKYQGKVTYEIISTMKYLDMVVSETLRKWPSNIASDRVCTKPYTIEPTTPEEKPIHLRVGDMVILPSYAIQRDPEYYPEPDRFDPERFNDENKHKINPYIYLPFGAGPRACIGSRFALLEAKILYFYLLSHFEIIPTEKTQIPIRLNRKAFNMAVEKGYWVGLKRRVL